MITRIEQKKKVEANRERMESFWRDYQWDFITDESPFKIFLKSRRIGISEAVLYECIKDCLSRPYYNVYLSSFALREAKELIRRATLWVKTIIPSCTGKPLGCKTQKTLIEFPNGSRMEALPAEKIRSRGGTVVLDEFAFYQNANDVLAAIMPATLTRDDMKVILISTPFGASGSFHDIWTNKDGQYDKWSRHKTDIYEAAEQGFPVDPQEVKEEYPSDIFAQEFECAFVSDENQYFGNDLLRSALYDGHWMDYITPDSKFHGGLDIAHTGDATAFVSLLLGSDKNIFLPATIIKEAGTTLDYTDQILLVEDLLTKRPFDLVGVDAAGEGSGMAQALASKYPSHIRPVKGSQWTKIHNQIPSMRMEMEKGTLMLPNDRNLLRAFRSIQKKTLSSRKVKWEASRTREGHADEFYAALLAYAQIQKTSTWSFS